MREKQQFSQAVTLDSCQEEGNYGLFKNRLSVRTDGLVGLRAFTVPTVDQSLVPRTYIQQLPMTLLPENVSPSSGGTFTHVHIPPHAYTLKNNLKKETEF